MAQFGTSTAGGLILNTGLIKANSGIGLEHISTFIGGITNTGTIDLTLNAIGVLLFIFLEGDRPAGEDPTNGTFSNDATAAGVIIDNSGTLLSTGAGIFIDDGTTLVGSIVNSGTISVGAIGIDIANVSTFIGGVTNTSTISAATGIAFNAVSSVSVFDSGTITGTSGTAVQFSSGINTFTLGPGYSIAGNVLGVGSDILALGGAGNGTFNLSSIGASQQYRGFGTFKVVGGSWDATGNGNESWSLLGGTFELGAGASISGNVVFNGAATLQLDTGTNQVGTLIAGMVAGDSVDLRFQTFATGYHVVWQPAGTGGTLSLLNASNVTLDTLNLSGTHKSTDFVPQSDNHGGTLIADVGAPTGPVATHDFNGDHTSDFLLADGNVYGDWLVQNGVIASGVGVGTLPSGWTIAGVGDFTGDGTDDLLLQIGSSLVDWVMHNGTVSTGVIITNGGLPPGWNAIGAGDFNGDGTADILLRNNQGLYDWTVHNGAIQAAHTIGTMPAGWNVLATGDFNGDSTTDIMLQASSYLVDWSMQNGTFSTGVIIGQLPAGWSVIGTGDFNGDGTTDLLLQVSNYLVDWTVRNGALSSAGIIGQLPAGWSVFGTGDYNGDGTSDLLLKNGQTLAVWTLQNGGIQHTYSEPALPAGYTIVPNKGLVA